MSKATTRKLNLQSEEISQPKYYDFKRDLNPFWRSSLFSEVYLKNDVPREYKSIWEHDEIADKTSGFFRFYDGFLDLVNKLEHSNFENWKEAETVKNWIVPIMVLLGWDTDSKTEDSYYIDNESFTLTEKDKKQTYRPDLLYFDKPKHKTYIQDQKDQNKKIAEAKDKKTGIKMIIEAKYWNRLSQKQTDSKKDKKIDDSAVGLGPDLQTLKYMEIFNLDFGILTDGKIWKLFHKELSQGVDRRNYNFDLERLKEIALDLTSNGNEEKYKHYAKYFYYFFAKQSFVQGENTTSTFVNEVFNYSKKYALNIEENLKKRFIISMGLTCNALKDSCDELKENLDLNTIRNVAESHIFNVLFVKSCEVRHVLPIRSADYVKVSLHEIVESLDIMRYDPEKDEEDFIKDFQHGETFGGKKFTYDGYQIFDRFINLYEIIHNGTEKSKDFGFEIEGFKESIFSKEEWKFAKNHKIKNRDMIKILFTLNFIESEFNGRKYQQIPYSYFTPRQLGSIYESFLEYRLEKAESDMIFHKGQWQKANIKSKQVKNLRLVDEHVVEKGDLFFSPNNEDRKMTGSYYTPDYIVKYIVENTLGPLVENRSSKEILELKVCDPAMGSGHFLAGALDFLVGTYREKWCKENNDDIDETIEETSRKILDSCLYGVDINPRAVKLAQMSLWLMTAYAGKKLERLDDQLIIGNSLIEIKWKNRSFLNGTNFNAIIGNPPWGAFIDEKDKEFYMEKYKNVHMRTLDTYNYFLYRSYNMLESTGRLGVIVPNTFIFQHEYTKARKYYLKKNSIESVINLGDGIFGATVPSCILILDRNEKKNIVFVGDIRKTSNKQDVLNKIQMDVVDVSSILKQEKAVIPMGEMEITLLNSIYEKASNKFIDYVECVSSGIGTGGDKIFRVASSDAKKLNLEKRYLKTVLIGRDFKDYFINNKDDHVVIYLDKKVKPDECPNIMNYLAPFKAKLSNKRETIKGLIPWWNLHWPRNKELFERNKIIIRQTASTIYSTVDNRGRYCLNSVLISIPKNENDLYLLVAILNSNLMRWIYKMLTMEEGRTFAEVKPINIKNLPIPDLLNLNKQVMKQLVEKSKSLILSNKGSKNDIVQEIDQIVYKFYNLTKIEIDFLEKNKNDDSDKIDDAA